VALGFTLLVTTLAARLRQRLRRPFSLPRIPARQAAAAYEASDRTDSDRNPTNAEGVAAGMALAARALAETAAPPAPSLAILLRRLQLAGDRLEEVARAVSEDNDDLDDTRLKEATPEVEYVFRACAR
jgi:hypothetical protein